jgi:parallel beta-helix repeat protein
MKNKFVFLAILLFLIALGIFASSLNNIYLFYGKIDNFSVHIIQVGDYEDNSTNSTNYAQFVDSSGVVLKKFSFDVYGNYFSFRTSVPSQTKKIIFYNDSKNVGEIPISANSPVISNVNIKTRDNGYLLSWNASDADSDNLTFSVYLDDGSRALVSDFITEKSFFINTDYLGKGSYIAVIRVSDGFNYAEAQSSQFSVAGKSPSAQIDIIDGSGFVSGEDIYVSGSVYDLDEGYLNNLVWKLDGNTRDLSDGYLTNLTLGNHVLSLGSIDSDGNNASEQVSFSVDNNSKPDISITNLSLLGSNLRGEQKKIEISLFNVRTDTICNLGLYDNNQLISDGEIYLSANQFDEENFDWIPQTSGNHEIKARVHDCYNPESNLGNNELSISAPITDIVSVDVTGCTNLNQSNVVYTLGSSVISSGTCFNVTADNVTLDCLNWDNLVIYGNNPSDDWHNRTYGIYSNRYNTAIRNCRTVIGPLAGESSNRIGIKLENAVGARVDNIFIANNTWGIFLEKTNNSYLSNLVLQHNYWWGMMLDNSMNNVITNVKTDYTSGGTGLIIEADGGTEYLGNNTVSGLNSSYNYDDGLLIQSSSNNFISDAITYGNNRFGVHIEARVKNTTINGLHSRNNGAYGIFQLDGVNTIVTNSVISDNGVYDFMPGWYNPGYIGREECNIKFENVNGSGGAPIAVFNESVTLIGGNYSELFLCGADNSKVENVNIAGAGNNKNNGMIIAWTNNSDFTNIVSNSNQNGIYVSLSSFNRITNCTTNDNANAGIYLYHGSNNNTLAGNTAIGNGASQIYIPPYKDYYAFGNVMN